MYHTIERLQTLYRLLRDDKSKEIFMAQFSVDLEPSVSNIRSLAVSGGFELGWSQLQKELLKKLIQKHKKIVLYGTGEAGQAAAKILKYEHINFYGFCGQDAAEFPDGLFGKPVISPNELLAHEDEYYAVLTLTKKKSYIEILKFLQEHNYPKEHLLDWINQDAFSDVMQYFEFPELYRRGTAFIDGGCFDCENSCKFAEWCGGAYSSIIAFEPDPNNYANCRKRLRDIPLSNFQLVNAGLSSRESTVKFNSGKLGGSHIISDGPPAIPVIGQSEIRTVISIPTVTLDDIVDDRTVGFIKMDIEGAEFDALHGAKNTILRDKPLLAICVYHRPGDMFTIMDYLHELLPEYRFLLRHYSVRETETVLYASVDL